MSPSAIAPLPLKALGINSCTLNEFAITENGFLPAQAPLAKLSQQCYQPWELLILHLPWHLERRTLRAEIDNVPQFQLAHLAAEAEWRRAYVILSHLAQGYIWGGKHAAEVLPPVLTVPLLVVSRYLELPPVATYSALSLWNFSSSTDNLSDLESLRSIHTFTGTADESWFYMVSVAIEAQSAYIIPIMLHALNAVKRRRFDIISNALEELCSCLQKACTLLGRMDERCEPNRFYHDIRPFLAGGKNMASAGLPHGVFYNEGHGRGKWLQLRGGSNGQSSLIQFIDLVLGVKHEHDPSSSPTGINFHEELRAYMPGPHRRFLEHVSKLQSIRTVVSLHCHGTEEQCRLQTAFREAIRALGELRNKHLQIVTRYIVIPASKQSTDETHSNLATASIRAATHLTGTGGTALLPFLKQTRYETYRAGDIEDQTNH